MSLREKQIKEAIKRMKMLKIHENAIVEFEKEGKINKSEFGGILYWLDDEEWVRVKMFEEKYGAVVYHVIKGLYKMCDGEVLEIVDYLYVSSDLEEWEMDREDIEENIVFVYSVSDFCDGEFGSICIKPSFGGVIRG